MYASYDPEFGTLRLETENGTALVAIGKDSARSIVWALGLPFIKEKWDRAS